MRLFDNFTQTTRYLLYVQYLFISFNRPIYALAKLFACAGCPIIPTIFKGLKLNGTYNKQYLRTYLFNIVRN